MRHQDLTVNHRLESFVYANAAARTGATGFVPGDVGRISFQQDNNTYWRLIDDSPVLWAAVQNNIVESFTYANTAARIGASGFVPGDVGKLAFQTDTAQYWRLTATTPVWLLVAPNKMETWMYATATDRTTATGFIANDVGRIAYQSDNGSYWRLTATTPAWQTVSSLNYFNASAAGATGFATNQAIPGSMITLPAAGAWKAGGAYHSVFDMKKTAAGTAVILINVHMGTAGTVADAIIGTLNFTVAGTAAVDTGLFDVYVTFQSVGSGTSAVAVIGTRLNKSLTATGLAANGSVQINFSATTAGFASTTQTAISLGFNGGTSFVGTNTFCQTEYKQLP